MKMTNRLMIGAVAALGFSFAAPVLAQTTITVSTWGGPNHGINTIVWPTWKAPTASPTPPGSSTATCRDASS